MESSRRDEFNGSRIMFLGAVDSELLVKITKMKNANNFSSIEARKIKIPPFDLSGYEDSEKLCFIFL